jgi:hypothetical protein
MKHTPSASSIALRKRNGGHITHRKVERPLPAADGYPVYPELVGSLLAVEPTEHSPLATHVCAAASGWAYSRNAAAAVGSVMHRLGLEDASCREVSLHNDGMLVASTSVLIQSACGRVGILCYRGTEPANMANWMADLDVNPIGVEISVGNELRRASVHGGFYRNIQATWPEVLAGLERALAGKHVGRSPKGAAANTDVDRHHGGLVQPLEALFITGHSLGAAMAAMAAVYLADDLLLHRRFRDKLRGVYTFGQPMIGGHDLVAACSTDPLLRDGMFRHVYGNDVVPHTPAAPSGAFEHFGREFHSVQGASWRERTDFAKQAPDIVWSTFVGPAMAFWGKQIARTRDRVQLGYSWYDHLPQFYIRASTPPDVRSEFHR